MSATDELLGDNEAYAVGFDKGSLPMPPGKQVAVVACMDARIETGRMLGLEEGDAHVIRNAGGVVTDDVIRSLIISQRLLGTREIMLIHHSDCGMLTFRDDDLKDAVEQDAGIRPAFAMEAFSHLEDHALELDGVVALACRLEDVLERVCQGHPRSLARSPRRWSRGGRGW